MEFPLKKLIGAALATLVLAGGVFLGGATANAQDDATQAGGFGQTGGISQLSGNNNWPY